MGHAINGRGCDMSPYYDKYKDLDARLTWVRWMHLGKRSAEEDTLLEEMDQAWLRLDESERLMLSEQPATDEWRALANLSPVMTDERVEPRSSYPVRHLVQAA